MQHLTTEELLRHCDGELSTQRSLHNDRCVYCQEAMAELQDWLFDVEQDLRLSVPPEPPEWKAASWARLQEALYPPKPVIGFPLRWSVAYALAAGLAIAVFSGYFALRIPQATAPVQISEARPPDAVPSIGQPAAERNTVEQQTRSAVLSPAAQKGPVRAEAVVPAPPQAAGAQRSTGSERGKTPAAVRSRPERFQMAALTSEGRPSRNRVLSPAAPPIATEPRLMAFAAVLDAELPFVAEPDQGFSSESWLHPEQPLKPEDAVAVLKGHWILTKAGAWQEDIQPVVRAGALYFEGSVENGKVWEQVTTGIKRAAGSSQVGFALQLRSEATAQATPLPASQGSDVRASGGVVRSSLLSHFSDAARRSFQAPEPTALESEMDRYVSDIFRSQSRLLSHVYALNRVLTSFDPELVSQLGPGSVDTFRRLAGFHLGAVKEQEAHIYDRLSEALPRRFWSYHAAKKDLAGERDWAQESSHLLKDALRLDATLTALLSTPETTIDASGVNLSCGELLGRIRSHLQHLRTPVQALQ